MPVTNKFDFKYFSVYHDRTAMKVGTDGVLLGAWSRVESAQRMLDAGTGTGVIALMLAQRSTSTACIDAIDIHQEACLQAQENVDRSPWPQKIIVHQQSLQEFENEPYDLIVSNPPFFINSYKPPVQGRAIARHTETLTHAELLFHSRRLLRTSGRLCIVLPQIEANSVKELANNQHWHCSRSCSFQSRKSKPIERVLLEFMLTPQPQSQEELVLYDHDQVWSENYRQLTKDFYLNA